MKVLSATLLVVGCSLPAGELLTPGVPPGPLWVDCEAALRSARVGDACSGITSCSAADAGCCVEQVRCSSGVISLVTRDCTACGTCAEDRECGTREWCVAGRCQSCPEVTNCRACLLPQVQLMRNGCRTCDCGPPSECGGCGERACVESRYCQAGCSGAGCCVLQCEAPSCGPGVVGCAMPCGAVPCRFCVASRCVCEAGSWRCEPVCAPAAEPWASRCRAP